jgi:hypothetical protein
MTDEKVPHPWIADWLGERSWSAPGEPQSEFLVFDTEADCQPFKIIHDRDMMFDHGALVQDYNFIDYFFGDEAKPIRARHYLGDDHVSVSYESNVPAKTTAEAASHLPAEVLAYLQHRFNRIDVLMAEGYQEIWPNPA